MKNVMMILAAVCLLAVGSVSAQGVKGTMAAGGYLGYSIGLGDVFDDIETEFGSSSSDAGIGFGGHFHYGVSEKFMIGGEIFLQSYSFEFDYDFGGFGSGSESESETKANFLATGLMVMNQDEKKAFFLTGGIGFYDFGDTNIGFNGGILYRWMVSETVGIYAMPRIHIVLADDMFQLIQISAGVQIPFGGNGSMSR
ncbi:hypothetical protein GF377_10625 [candidate division GN15 bacterium]|nr:hypothetical protein [candidate division GN15 bacterium]